MSCILKGTLDRHGRIQDSPLLYCEIWYRADPRNYKKPLPLGADADTFNHGVRITVVVNL